MTPDEVAEIRTSIEAFGLGYMTAERMLALCDALEAAWAALVDLQAWADHESERADRAEEASANERQKVVNLTAELAVVNDHLSDVIERAERAEADVESLQRQNDKLDEALARVRALCDEPARQVPFATVSVQKIRAAIEGP